MALALQILDGAPFRPGGKIPMSVTQAKFEQKGSVYLIFNTSFANFLIVLGYSKPWY